ncbi:hypothetical protein IIA16_03820, partial [bacterium]|nr:hypothetical protein [bacterium]
DGMCQPYRDDEILWDLFGEPHPPGTPAMRRMRIVRVAVPTLAALTLGLVGGRLLARALASRRRKGEGGGEPPDETP